MSEGKILSKQTKADIYDVAKTYVIKCDQQEATIAALGGSLLQASKNLDTKDTTIKELLEALKSVIKPGSNAHWTIANIKALVTHAEGK